MNMTNEEATSVVPVDTYGGSTCSNGESPQGNVQLYDRVVSPDVLQVIGIIFSVVLIGVIGLLGSAANVINIVVFFKQGFDDSVNISLFGLAVSDLFSLLPFVWRSIGLNPLFQDADIGFDSGQVQYLTSGWPHSCFIRITCCITAFITFERCVCIALPMKVKDIITPKRTLISVVAMFLVLLASVSPVYFTIRLASSFQIGRNKSMYVFSYARNTEAIQNISFSITVFAQLSSFIIVVVCTMILIHNLRAMSQWRHKATAASSDSMSVRDKRVMKVVTMLAVIFIVCLLPSSVTVILMILLSTEFSNTGQYRISYQLSWTFLFVAEAINSSVSILVYYNLNSKFRTGFNNLFVVSTSAVNEI